MGHPHLEHAAVFGQHVADCPICALEPILQNVHEQIADYLISLGVGHIESAPDSTGVPVELSFICGCVVPHPKHALRGLRSATVCNRHARATGYEVYRP